MAELLLEIGFEEMPATWLARLGAQLRQSFEAAAAREHLSPRALLSYWTPRRLVLRGELRARQEDREERVWGPTLKIARDASGAWTKAALGFARKNGVELGALQHAARDASAPDELYLLHVRKTAGLAGADVLPGVTASVLRSFSFPKRMSWDAWLQDGKGAFPFGRPIRWIVLLLDGSVVPFQIHRRDAGGPGEVIVSAGDSSYGHRFLPREGARGALRVRSFAELESGLETRFVLLDPARREQRIREGLARAAGSDEARDEHGLADEWRDLVEYPTVLAGKVPAEFHALPIEVLQTVLVHHQKYVPLLANGVVGRFAAVVNGDGGNAAEIVRGMERVVVARLRDAAFFFAEDRKRRLSERAADLAGVTFHQGLGSYADKSGRMLRLVDAMRSMGALDAASHQAARAAAALAKADLTTLMVREFPELQGVMGGLYLASEASEPAAVVDAVRLHYLPVSVEEDAAPRGLVEGSGARVFGAVSLADKLDTLAGYFGLGLAPTGSSDPFGLRRAGQGAVRVLVDFWGVEGARADRPSLRSLAAAALEGYPAGLARPASDLAPELCAFLLERLRYLLTARGYPADEVDACLGAREPDALDDPHEVWLRLQALHRVRGEAHEDFEHLAVAFKRARNILGDAGPGTVDPALFREDAERELHDAVRRLQQVDGGYESRLRSLAALRGPVDRFFDDVLVMAEDPRLRANRLSLLSPALSLFYRIADISKLGGQS